ASTPTLTPSPEACHGLELVHSSRSGARSKPSFPRPPSDGISTGSRGNIPLERSAVHAWGTNVAAHPGVAASEPASPDTCPLSHHPGFDHRCPGSAPAAQGEQGGGHEAAGYVCATGARWHDRV